MFVGPADETVKLSLAVKDVQSLAVEVLFPHLADDADGPLPHGLEMRDQTIRGEAIECKGLCEVKSLEVEVGRLARAAGKWVPQELLQFVWGRGS